MISRIYVRPKDGCVGVTVTILDLYHFGQYLLQNRFKMNNARSRKMLNLVLSPNKVDKSPVRNSVGDENSEESIIPGKLFVFYCFFIGIIPSR